MRHADMCRVFETLIAFEMVHVLADGILASEKRIVERLVHGETAVGERGPSIALPDVLVPHLFVGADPLVIYVFGLARVDKPLQRDKVVYLTPDVDLDGVCDRLPAVIVCGRILVAFFYYSDFDAVRHGDPVGIDRDVERHAIAVVVVVVAGVRPDVDVVQIAYVLHGVHVSVEVKQ